MKCVWIANDGTQFETQQACFEYENFLQVRLLSENEVVPFIDDSGTLAETTAFYVNAENVNAFIGVLEKHGIIVDGIKNAGYYYFSDNTYEWVNVEDEIEEYTEHIAELKRLMKRLQ